jgi:hypothetical protein
MRGRPGLPNEMSITGPQKSKNKKPSEFLWFIYKGEKRPSEGLLYNAVYYSTLRHCSVPQANWAHQTYQKMILALELMELSDSSKTIRKNLTNQKVNHSLCWLDPTEWTDPTEPHHALHGSSQSRV